MSKKLIVTLKKSIFLVLSILLSISVLATDGKVDFENSWGKHGITAKEQDKNHVVINSSISSFNLTDTQLDKGLFQTITTSGVFLQNESGAPNIPTFSSYIAVPQGAKVITKITNMETEAFQNLAIAPAPVIPKDNDNSPLIFEFDNNIYNSNALYPSNVVQTSEPMKIRGMDVVLIGISPFQYNPVTKEMLVHKNIEVEVIFEGGNQHFGEDRLRNRWWDPIIGDAVLNPSVIEEPQQTTKGINQIGCEYLIIVPDHPDFLSWADSIKIFRNQQGILTDIVTTTEIGGNTINNIESYIDLAYYTWDIPPSAVLLMGDYGDQGNTIISPIYDNYCASDNIFADVDNDHMPDIIFARMTAQNSGHLETFVSKFINYETSPPTDPDFYNHPITALGWQTERWFQICSETVGGFFKHTYGKDPIRINALYGGNPATDPWSTATNTSTVLNYFGPNGLGYIPASPTDLGGWSGGSSADVNNAINNGAFILQHRDHGNSTGWGEPSYNSNNINGLTNTNLSFIFSINCLTGKFNNAGECFAEKFHRHKYNGENSGALGIIAASEVSYSFVNDTYVWGMYDNMWPEFMPDYGTEPESRGILPAFGNAAGKYFLKQSSWPYNTGNKEVTYNLFHHHGDAFSVVYSEIPQYLTVSHDQGIIAGELSFTVNADDESFIALTVNNEIIGTAEGTGQPVVISIPAQVPPNQILVTVTKQNYYRYSSTVDVIPPEGAYVIYNDVLVNNTSGLMTTGEETIVDLTVKNIGVEEGENISVSLTSSDEYVEMIDDTEDYGSIAPNATQTMPEGFSWNVANNIPDMHVVMFNVESTDADNTWLSKMYITGHAPSLAIGGMSIDDSESGNGNGRMDAGEIIDVRIQTINEGSSAAINTMGYLSCNSPYVSFVTDEYLLGDIDSDGSSECIFTIEISEATPIGSIIEFDYEASAGEYNAEKSFTQKAGLVIEDWETGDMSRFNWQTGGNSEWEISSTVQYEGSYCNKSGFINDNQSTWMSIIYEAAIDDSVTFYLRVSSENGYDFFRFFIDGTQKFAASGEQGWQRLSFPVTQGTHLFKWQYAKDASVSSGDDCAYIDYLVLPTPPITSAFAGQDAEFCENDIIQCFGASSNCIYLEWTTSGTGTFNNPEINSPVYYPSEQDIEDGYVTLTIAGTGSSTTITDDVMFTFEKSPVVNPGDDITICSNSSVLFENASAENYNEILWTSEGDGFFDDATQINSSYTPGVNDIEQGNVSLTLSATGGDLCGTISESIALSVLKAATAFAGEDTDICPGVIYHITDASFSNYEEITWQTSGDGTFSDMNAANPTYTPGVSDKSTKEVTLSVEASNSIGCSDAQDEIMITILCTDITELNNLANFSIFPNPNNGSFTLNLSNVVSNDNVLSIFNSQGKIVHKESLSKVDNTSEYKVDLDVPAGIYTIKLTGAGLNITKAFIKN